ncbi:50S ribosomal protein L13 [Candidatus Omnitrophota bacterium]
MRKAHKTYIAKTKTDADKKWYIVDADGKILGRLATRIATILMGKTKPEYTAHVDCGDFVVVINAKKIRIKGANKPKNKVYQRYTGFMSGLKETTFEEMLETKPTEIIREAVRKMLPKNNLGRLMLRKLKVYADSEHKHTAQQPEQLTV